MSASARASAPSLPVALVIGYVWPEPDSSAAGSRMMQLTSAFQQRDYRVVFASPADESSHAVELEALGIETRRIELNASSFDDWIAVLQPALVMFDRFMMEEQFGWRVEKNCPDALRVLDMEDVHSLRDARWKAVKQKQVEGLELPLLSDELAHSELAIREVASIWRCDLTLVISQAEMDWLQTRYQLPASLLSYTPFMEQSNTSLDVPGFDERQHFISIGNFRHAPNWDAVRLLKEQVWPRLRKCLPEVELHIYGGYPPKKATDLHNPKQGFLVKGWADDAQEVVRNARVMLAPLRFGAGLKGKLIDASRNGTPAVTTPVGSEGMYFERMYGDDPVCPAVTCDSVEELIEHAVRIYTQPEAWQVMSDAGQQLIPARFDAVTHQQVLMDRIGQLRNRLPEHRQSHFYGLMLRHHSLKSTQYMSQWIEAKNSIGNDQ